MKFTLMQYQILKALVEDELEELKKYYGSKAPLEGIEDYRADLESMERTFNNIKF